jgi:two-component sensor histidine kinase
MSELDALLSSGTSSAVLDAVMGATPTLAFIADCEGRILRASRFVSTFAGLGPEAFEGRPVSDLRVLLRTSDREGRLLEIEELPIRRALRGERVLDAECSLTDRFGEPIPVAISAAPILKADGELIGAITSAADLRRPVALERQLRAAVAEKEVLYRELAHRVKNHFQLIVSLVVLETRESDSAAAKLAQRMISRIRMLAAVYDRMGQADVGGRIGAKAFLEEVVGPYRTASVAVCVFAPDGLTLDPDQAGPLGMLVNEAVNNSYKHAFPGRSGRIEATLRSGPSGRLELRIADNGVGFAHHPRPGSQGLQLMRLLARQLGGEIDASNRPEGGAQVTVDLPASLAQG